MDKASGAMGKKGSVRKSLLGLLEGVSHRSCPGKSFGRANKGISEGTENGGGARNKTAIEVNEAKETLEIFDGGWLRIISDSLDKWT